jgi:hypothetical protein
MNVVKGRVVVPGMGDKLPRSLRKTFQDLAEQFFIESVKPVVLCSFSLARETNTSQSM